MVRRGKALLFYDADSHAETALPLALDKFPDVLVTQPFAFVSPVLVNLDTARAVGISQQRPLALSSLGLLLLTDGDPATSGLVSGPLRWATPSLPSW